ncbi:long chain acyl-CoA synthetase 4-like protein [Tanacetum coccineum]
MEDKKYIIEVEPALEAKDGRPSMGPVYRSVFAKDGFPSPIDGLDSCWDIFRMSAEKYPDNKMLGTREFVDGKGGKCGIYGVNCAEWIISMEACNAHGLHCIPLYDTLGKYYLFYFNGAGAVEFIIGHAEVTIVFVEEKKISEVLKTFPKAGEYLKTIVSFGQATPEQKEQFKNFGATIHSWDEFLSLGKDKQFDLPVKKKTDICTIMYTSGTTGDPKGVLISNNSIVTLIAGVRRVLDSCNESDVKLLIEDIGELKPTIFCAVPRVLERIYSGLQQKISSGSFLKSKLFNLAYSYKLYNMKGGSKHSEASILSDKLVFAKVKQMLGGRVRIILSGAAPLSSHVEGFLKVVACCHVLQGYGLTETCAGSFVSLPNEMSMLGTGEICIRGDTLFSGYYKRDDLTKEVLIDGWFHTGDIGEWQPDGSMKVIDRKKNIFKLAQGEYVAVENLENIYVLVPAVDEVWVYGNSFESCLVAVVNPNKRSIESWAHENDISEELDSICQNPKTKEYILGELNRIGKEKKKRGTLELYTCSMYPGPALKGFEFIKAVHIDPVPFDIERDLLTPTLKKKRPQMLNIIGT